MFTRTAKFLFTLIAGVLATTFATPRVLAQDKELAVEEVVVTARKREEALLDIPLTVTAFSSSDIEEMALNELQDIVEFSPGFHYAQHSVGRGGRFNRRLIFRGMNPRTDRQSRQGASVFIDGAPILGSEIGATDNYERIEVIKGPQSAYFGRSTFSGAINAVTRTPGDEWAGQVNAEAARFGTSRFGGQIEGPLIDGKLAFRLTGSQYDTKGEYQNAANPTQRLGAESTTDVGLSFFATPSENFTAKLRLHYWTDQDGPSVGISLARPDYPELHNCSPGGVASGDGTWICGKVPLVNPGRAVAVDATLTPELRQEYYNSAMLAAFPFSKVPYGFGLERHAQEASLVLDYEFSNGITLSSITAFHENEYASFEDIDRRPTAGEIGRLFGFPASADSYQMTFTGLEDFSQEFRLSSDFDQRLRWTIGASYFESSGVLVSFSRLSGVPPRPNSTVLTFDPETTAIFGSIGWDITDQFTLSVEARSQADKVVEGVQGGTPLSETFNSFTPRIILDYKPNPDTTLYFTYAEGTNPGQFNAGLVNRSQNELDQIAAQGGGGIAVEEEELTNLELGVKARFWDGRAQLTAAVYFSDWDNIVAPELFTIINDDDEPEIIQVNSTGGQADLSGLELEGTFLLSEKFTLDTTIALTQSDINDFESPDALSLLGERTIDGLGKEFSRFPKTSGTLSLTYEDSLTADYDWYIRGDVIYRGSMWMSNANVTETGDATTVNLRAGVETESWRIEVYGTNIFDEEGYTGLQRLLDLSGQSGVGFAPQQVVAGLLPRASFGVRASLTF